ncbi:MAG: YqjK family protein [Burkholderiales bacterium]|nr:YqjK family protein [Burkholderiales bacterium]
MFTDSLIELARRKERLIARSGQQRIVISVACLQLQKPLSVVDRGIAIVSYLKAHPLVLAAGVVAAAIIGRRNLPRLIGRGFFVWRAWRAAGVLMRNPGS